MKTKKFNLNQLKVKSFITQLENGRNNTIQGGRPAAIDDETIGFDTNDCSNNGCWTQDVWVCHSVVVICVDTGSSTVTGG